MGSGCRVTAGPANDTRCVCDVEALGGGRVQVNTRPGGRQHPPSPFPPRGQLPRYTSPVLYLPTSSVCSRNEEKTES